MQAFESVSTWRQPVPPPASRTRAAVIGGGTANASRPRRSPAARAQRISGSFAGSLLGTLAPGELEGRTMWAHWLAGPALPVGLSIGGLVAEADRRQPALVDLPRVQDVAVSAGGLDCPVVRFLQGYIAEDE